MKEDISKLASKYFKKYSAKINAVLKKHCNASSLADLDQFADDLSQVLVRIKHGRSNNRLGIAQWPVKSRLRSQRSAQAILSSNLGQLLLSSNLSYNEYNDVLRGVDANFFKSVDVLETFLETLSRHSFAFSSYKKEGRELLDYYRTTSPSFDKIIREYFKTQNPLVPQSDDAYSASVFGSRTKITKRCALLQATYPQSFFRAAGVAGTMPDMNRVEFWRTWFDHCNSRHSRYDDLNNQHLDLSYDEIDEMFKMCEVGQQTNKSEWFAVAISLSGPGDEGPF